MTLVASPSSAFSVSIPGFAVNQEGAQADSATFAPTMGGAIAGTLSMTATGVMCGPLPAPISLSGASGAAPAVSPTSLSFGATCGGGPPASQTFAVTNAGDGDMVWSMSGLSGTGAARYTLAASPSPGVLIPGASAIVTVGAAPIPSPSPSTDPSTFSAQVTITTDVPFDPAHVVTLGETPLGDQLSFSSTPAR